MALQWRGVEEAAELMEHLWDSVVWRALDMRKDDYGLEHTGKHGDFIYVVELAI